MKKNEASDKSTQIEERTALVIKSMINDAQEEITDNVTMLRNLYSQYKGNDHEEESKRLVNRNEYLRQLIIMLRNKIEERRANDN